MKKLVTLLLVLGLASYASAAGTMNWDNGGDGTSWEDNYNWADQLGVNNDALPTITDIANCYMAGTNTVTVTSTGVAVTNKLQLKNDISDMVISGDLVCDGSLELYSSGTAGNPTLTVAAGGTLDASRLLGPSSFGTVKIGRATWMGGATLNVDGTMLAGTVDVGTYGAGLAKGITAPVRLNVGSAGLVTCTALGINLSTADYVDLAVDITSGGVIKIAGNVQAAMDAARTAGRLIGDGTVGNVTFDFDGTDTIVQVPEPATIALLGLGGLLLRKKR